jgi:alpha-glucuronidase
VEEPGEAAAQPITVFIWVHQEPWDKAAKVEMDTLQVGLEVVVVGLQHQEEMQVHWQELAAQVHL